MARAHRLGGRGVQPSWWSQLSVRAEGMAAPDGAGTQAGVTGSPAQPVVAALSAPVGDGCPQWCRLTGWGDRESSPAGGRSSRCTCGGWQPPMVQAHRLEGQGV